MPISDQSLKLFIDTQNRTTKFSYFLLGAAGAASAFALNQIREFPISEWSSFYAVSLVYWLLSAACGLIHLHHRNIASVQHLKVTVKLNDGEKIPYDWVNDIQSTDDTSVIFYHSQPYLLFAGAVFFAIWNVAGMLSEAKKISCH